MTSAFQAAINLVKEHTESIVTKVEEAAMAAVTSSILGVDEKTQQESVKEMADSSKLETGKASAPQDIPRKSETEVESLRGELRELENEIKTWKSRYTEAINEKRRFENESLEETRLLKERLSMLSFKLGNLQDNTKKEEDRQFHEGSEQFEAERLRADQLQSTVDTLRRQCEQWEETVSAKEIEIFELKQKLRFYEEEQKGSFGEEIKQEPKRTFKQEPERTFNQPEEQEEKLLPTGDLQRLEEESELDQEERMMRMEGEQKEREEQQEEFKSSDEPLLSQEEILERLKQHNKLGAPAVVAGGARIKQNPKGPHVTHKPTLVEKRDEKNVEEQFGTAEDTSKQITKQERALALEKKEQFLERIAIDRVPSDSKAIASTYFPPVPQHGSEKRRTKPGLKEFQTPLQG